MVAEDEPLAELSESHLQGREGAGAPGVPVVERRPAAATAASRAEEVLEGGEVPRQHLEARVEALRELPGEARVVLQEEIHASVPRPHCR